MQNNLQPVIEELKTAKDKGLSFYDAVQFLKSKGYTQEIIDNATEKFSYQEGKILTPDSPSNVMTQSNEDLENEIEDMKEQEAKDKAERMAEGFGNNFRL